MRPITIPPFMDRVVQATILRVLEAIYEPWFDKLNRSFGFRPNKGCHDAIYNITRKETRGLTTAIEGDIKGAYDNVSKEKLIKILEKRIKDRKFINLIKERLDYIYFDSVTGKYVEDKTGIPQGGIDSPYLWNIYMHEFDLHINSHLEKFLGELNNKVRKGRGKGSMFREKGNMKLTNKRTKLLALLKFINKNPTLDLFTQNIQNGMLSVNAIREFYSNKDNLLLSEGIYYVNKHAKYEIMREVHKINHKIRRLPTQDLNKIHLRHVYCRYADDWIILGNFNKLLAEKIKDHISKWLEENLAAKLSMEKTIITDIRRAPAHFLGFEIKSRLARKMSYVPRGSKGKPTLMRIAGQEVNAWPDKQRLISRLHMKGYCTHNGKPVSLRWLSSLEIFVIIERFNAVLRGLINYYNGFLHQPSSLARWIFIIRKAAMCTIARKLNITVRKLYKRMGLKVGRATTISCKVRTQITSRGKLKVYTKRWSLLTYKELLYNEKANVRYEAIQRTFEDIEYRKLLPFYSGKGKPLPVVTNDNYLDSIVWVNLRTHAGFNLPCALCGSDKEVEMHHIKHVRKSPFHDLPENKEWMKMMALRNRNQIPVCRECHMNKIHRGEYSGANLKSLSPKINLTPTGYDLRLMNYENFLNPSNTERIGKTLEEKGWKLEISQFLNRKK